MNSCKWARICLLYPPDIQASHLQHSIEISELTTNHSAWALDSREASSTVWSAQGEGLQLTWLCTASLPATSNSSIFHCRQCYILVFPLHQKMPPAFDNEIIVIPNPGHSLPQTRAPPSETPSSSCSDSVPHPDPVSASCSCPAPLANAVSPLLPICSS